jgi:hypothetical protein
MECGHPAGGRAVAAGQDQPDAQPVKKAGGRSSDFCVGIGPQGTDQRLCGDRPRVQVNGCGAMSAVTAHREAKKNQSRRQMRPMTSRGIAQGKPKKEPAPRTGQERVARHACPLIAVNNPPRRLRNGAVAFATRLRCSSTNSFVQPAAHGPRFGPPSKRLLQLQSLQTRPATSPLRGLAQSLAMRGHIVPRSYCGQSKS